MLIDTHCHLTDERFTDVGAVLKQAFEVGVEKVIIPSTSVEDSRKAVAIADKYGQYCLVGIHPEEVGRMLENKTEDQQGVSSQDFVDTLSLQGRLLREIQKLEEILKSSKRVVGVGEIGLDFYYDKERKTKDGQVRLFRDQLQLALENNLPVAIHMREAEEEMREELGNIMRAIHESPLQITKKSGVVPNFRGQFHCFAGSEEFLKKVLSLGFYVSFGGNITYKSAGNLRELLKLVPMDRLLMETDSPYLPPEPLRGTVNTPSNVKITAEFVARELQIELSELAETTYKNTKCLYTLDI